MTFCSYSMLWRGRLWVYGAVKIVEKWKLEVLTLWSKNPFLSSAFSLTCLLQLGFLMTSCSFIQYCKCCDCPEHYSEAERANWGLKRISYCAFCFQNPIILFFRHVQNFLVVILGLDALMLTLRVCRAFCLVKFITNASLN